jgi:hypothetical protein
LGQGAANQLFGVGLRLAEDFGVLDIVKGLGEHFVWRVSGSTSQRLQGALANIDPPDSRRSSHLTLLRAADGAAGRRRAAVVPPKAAMNGTIGRPFAQFPRLDE